MGARRCGHDWGLNAIAAPRRSTSRASVLVVALVTLAVVGLPRPAGAAEAHPGVGVVFDIRDFNDGPDGGGIDDRFAGGATWDKNCEFDTEAKPYAQQLRILQPDTCKPQTDGAPRPGIVPMHRTFDAAAGESYLSWAYARVWNPKGAFVARINLIARNGSGVLRVCGGNGSAVGQTTADFVRIGTGVCTMPAGTTMVTIEFAAEARAAGAAGAAVLNRLQFLRCANASASCPTSVPTTAPPPPPTSVPPPPPDDGGFGDVGGNSGSYVEPPADGGGESYPSYEAPAPDDTGTTLPQTLDGAAPTSTTSTTSGEEVTLRPIADESPEEEGGDSMVLVVVLLTVVVLAGTAAGWWALRR